MPSTSSSPEQEVVVRFHMHTRGDGVPVFEVSIGRPIDARSLPDLPFVVGHEYSHYSLAGDECGFAALVDLRRQLQRVDAQAALWPVPAGVRTRRELVNRITAVVEEADWARSASQPWWAAG